MRNKIFYGWWIVLACFSTALFVSSVIQYSFTAFMEPIANEFGWSYTQISFASSLRGLEMGLLAPIVGVMVGRWGSRKLICAGFITIGIGLYMLSVMQTLSMFYIAFIVIAFGAGGCMSVTTMTLVINWFDKNAGKALGMMSAGFGASGLFVPVVIWLIDSFGWRHAFAILAVIIWTAGIPITLVIRNRPEECGCLPDGSGQDESSAAAVRQQDTPTPAFIDLVKNRSFVYLNLAEAIRFLILSSVITHILPYLGTVGIPRATAGLAAAGIPLLSIFGRFGFGWLSDKFDKRLVSASAYGLVFIGLITLNYVQGITTMAIFILFLGPGLGGLAVLRATIVRGYFGRKFFANMIGIVSGVSAVGGVIGPTLTGWIYDTTGTYTIAWLGATGLVVLATCLILNIKPEV